MAKYECPSCGEEIQSERLGIAVHNHYVREIAKNIKALLTRLNTNLDDDLTSVP